MEANKGVIDRIKNILTRAYGKGGGEIIKKKEKGTSETGAGSGQDEIGYGDYYFKNVKVERTRLAGYVDFDRMDEEYPELACITGDTIIHCLDGDISIRELTEKRAEKQFWVYSCNGNRIVLDRAYAPRLKYRNVPILCVRYRSNNRWTHELKVTPEHRIMLRDGTMKMAKDLRLGESIMPFNSWYIKGRRMIKKLDGEALLGSHLVYEEYYGIKIDDEKIVHHKDQNRGDDSPCNLEIMSREEHGAVHSTGNRYSLGHYWADDLKRVEKHRKRLVGNDYKKGKPTSTETRKKMSEAHTKRRELGIKRDRLYGKPWNKKEISPAELITAVEKTHNYKEASKFLDISVPVFFKRIKEFNLKESIDYNHTVVSIIDGGVDDVYDLTTVRTHKFAAGHSIISNSALDIYADNTIAGEEDNEKDRFAIESEDENGKKVLDDMNKRAEIDQAIWPISRDLCKYGDEFEEIVIDNANMVVRLKPLPENQIYRNQDKYGRLLEDKAFEQKDNTGHVIAEFQPWQIVHFRNIVSRKIQYGRSILAPARRLFKQIQMIEDGMIVSRLSRAHMRYVHKVDVGELSPVEAEALVERVKRKTKKKRKINPHTGKFDVDSNPLTVEEDFFVAVRDGSPAGIERLEGQTNLGMIKDVEYFQNKMFSVIKVPKSWLGLEKDVSAKAIITNQDVQFARTIRRVQNVGLKTGLRKIYDIGLLLQGYDLTKIEYSILFPAIKTIDEVRKWEIEKAKAEIAKIYGLDLDMLTDEFILSFFLGLSDDEVKDLIKDREKETPSAQKAKEKEAALKIAKAKPPEENMIVLLKILQELKDVVAMELEGKKFRIAVND